MGVKDGLEASLFLTFLDRPTHPTLQFRVKNNFETSPIMLLKNFSLVNDWVSYDISGG